MKNLLRSRRVRFLPQMEMAECGAACLAMVLDYHGGGVPLSVLREACGVSRDGVNARGILHAARFHGLEAAGVRASVESLRDLPLPAILHWEFKHFVVLESISRRGAVIVDPAIGRRHVANVELDRAFTGVVVSLTKGPKFVSRPRRSVSVTRYAQALRTVWPTVVRMLSAAMMLNLLSVAAPAGTQVLVDHVLKPQRDEWLLPLLAVISGAALARILLRLARERALLIMHLAIDTTLFTQFVDRMSRLPPGFFDQRTTGDLMQRVDANRSLRDLTSHLVSSVLDGFLLVSLGALMVAYDATLAALVLALSVVRLVVVILARPYLEQAVASELTHRGREQTVLIDSFHAPEIVKAFGMQQRLLGRFVDRLTDRLNAQMASATVWSRVGQFTSLFDSASLVAVLYVGGQSVLSEEMSVGVLTGFLSLNAFLRTPLEALVSAYQQIEQARGILLRIDDVVDTPLPDSGHMNPGVLRGEVTFDRVCFRYAPRDPWVIDDLSIRIRPGGKTAIVGRSGQGKSTFLRMLLGMIPPEKGTVLVDGMDLRSIRQDLFLRQVGVVLQEPFVVDETVYDNIAFRRPHILEEDVRWAARVACIDDVIESLPLGYQTRLSRNGARLSGGQKQRLSLARALAGRPRILVLDEATSALDAHTEARVEANLRELGCTRIVVAHRIDTVRDADQIIVIESGHAVQSGRYEELSSSPGIFAALQQTGGAS